MNNTEACLPSSEIPALYDRIAPTYDVWAWLTESRAREFALLARREKAAEILEVAVGTGTAFVELVRSNPEGMTIGIDLSDGMLRQARKKAAGLPGRWELRRADARSLPFEDGRFELLMSEYMLDLLPLGEIRSILAEFHRVLRPGGKLILASMARGKSAPTRIYESLFRMFPRLAGGCRPLSLPALVAKAGFSIQSRDYITQFLFPSEVIGAKRPLAQGTTA